MCSMNLGPFLTTSAYSVMKSSVRVGAKAAVAWKLPHNTCVCVCMILLLSENLSECQELLPHSQQNTVNLWGVTAASCNLQ